MKRGGTSVSAILAAFMLTSPLCGQPPSEPLEPFAPPVLTPHAYERAWRLLDASERNPVRNVDIGPNWIGDEGQFWYRRQTAQGAEFQLVDPGTLSRAPAFDHSAVAAALSRVSGQPVSPHALPFRSFTFASGRTAIAFDAFGASWLCALEAHECTPAAPRFAANQSIAPDGAKAVLRRDRNLRIRMADGDERALTSDGVKFNEYAYVSGNSQLYVLAEGLAGGMAPALSWSPDSSRLLTHRIDETAVADMSLWQGAPADGSLRPRITIFKQSQPGDAGQPITRYVIFDVASGKRIEITGLSPDLLFDPIGGYGNTGPWLAEWSSDSRFVYALARDRHHKKAVLVRIDAASGHASPVVTETSPTFVTLDASHAGGIGANIRILHGRGELLWFSERDGWGHIYRHDLDTGTLLNQVTAGPWLVSKIIDVDEERGLLYFLASGREKGRSPYSNSLYRVNLDGTGETLLTPEDADHVVSISPRKDWFVDRYSRVDSVPRTVLRSIETGKILMTVEDADVSAFAGAGGGRPPVPFVAKGRDGRIDIFGTMHLPSNMDATKRYPIIDHVYPGAHFILPDVQGFSRSYFFRQAIADLGFIVVNMDGLGTPGRGKAFHDFSYGNLQDGPGLPDHVAAIRDLARAWPQMDLDRVGILGHSSGGYGAVQAMLTFPDFYKVGVASAPAVNMCGAVPIVVEKWQGLSATNGGTCDAIVLANMADKLRGKLMLAYGDMDEHVPPATMIQFIDALTRANRDYDLIVMPNRTHGFAADRYFIRRMLDYFVRNLMGSEPPADRITDPANGEQKR